jgi:hypothetical protein
MVAATQRDQSALIDLIGRSGRPALATWRELEVDRPPTTSFEPQMVADLPEPACRWLTHAISPGTPLWQSVVLEMHGHLRITAWLPFKAVQLHAPPHGYVWAARAMAGPIPIVGYDRYTSDDAEMWWGLFGRVPLVHATGADLNRAAAARAAIDAIFVPTACIGSNVTWTEGTTRDSAVAEWHIGTDVQRCELTVSADGSLSQVTMLRWAKPKGEEWGEYPFGGLLEGEVECHGIRVPRRARVGYFMGTKRWDQGEFFRAEITSATYA